MSKWPYVRSREPRKCRGKDASCIAIGKKKVDAKNLRGGAVHLADGKFSDSVFKRLLLSL